ncbi:MAG TPA: hypothetical protein VF879_00855 [Nitrospirales bacterium]
MVPRRAVKFPTASGRRNRGRWTAAFSYAILRDFSFSGSYSALLRFVGRLEDKLLETFLRVETRPPGEEA